jgi:hypothetical protein
MPTAPSLYNLATCVRLERLKVFDSVENYRSAVTTSTTIRSAVRLVLLAVKGDAAVTTATCANYKPGFIDELQWG